MAGITPWSGSQSGCWSTGQRSCMLVTAFTIRCRIFRCKQIAKGVCVCVFQALHAQLTLCAEDKVTSKLSSFALKTEIKLPLSFTAAFPGAEESRFSGCFDAFNQRLGFIDGGASLSVRSPLCSGPRNTSAVIGRLTVRRHERQTLMFRRHLRFQVFQHLSDGIPSTLMHKRREKSPQLAW